MDKNGKDTTTMDQKVKKIEGIEDAFLTADGTLTGIMDELVDAYITGCKGKVYPITKKEIDDFIDTAQLKIEHEEEKKVARYWERAYLPYDEFG